MINVISCPVCEAEIIHESGVYEDDNDLIFEDPIVYCSKCYSKVIITPTVDVEVTVVHSFTVMQSKQDIDGTCLFTFEYDGQVYTTTGETEEDAITEANKLVKAMEVSL